MANPAGPTLPLTSLKDAELRRILEPLVNGWRVRNGELGNGDERFITKADLFEIVQGDTDFANFARDSLGIAGIENNSQQGFTELGGLTVGQVLDALTGSITEEQLFKDLGDKIALIDAPENVANSVNNRLASAQRVLIDGITSETDQRLAQNQLIAQELADTATQLTQRIFDEAVARDNAVIAARDGLTAALAIESSARVDGDIATTQFVSQLAARTDNALAGIEDRLNVSVMAGQSTADRVSSLAVQVGDNAAAIVNESTARATQDAVLAQQLQSTVAVLDGQLAAIRSTSTANATQLETLAQQLDQIVVSGGGQTAGIDLERTARIAADEALATQISNVSARTEQNAADIVSESQARTTADMAQASQIDALITRVGASEAAITNEQIVRSSSDNSLASSISGLTARVGGVESSILNEAQARVDGDSANANQINGIALRTGSIEADLTEFKTVTADNFTAALGVIDQKILQFNNTTVQAGFSAEQQARINADNAITNAVNSQFSVVNNNVAIIDSKATTAANQAASAVSQVNTLQTRVNNVSASVQTEQTARVNADNSLFAQYSVKIDANNVVSGFGLSSTGPTDNPSSAFIIRADRFAIASPSRSGFSLTPTAVELPFIVTTTTQIINGVSVPPGTYIRNAYIQNGVIDNAKIGNAAITTAKIADLSVDTLKIAGDAVTVPVAASGSTGQIGTNTSQVSIFSASAPVTKRNLIVANGRTVFAGGDINTSRYSVSLLANGVPIYDTGPAPFLAVFYAFSILHTQPANSSITYTVRLTQTGSGTTSSTGNITIFSAKR